MSTHGLLVWDPGLVFPIPMRGNESCDLLSTERPGPVSNPHEG